MVKVSVRVKKIEYVFLVQRIEQAPPKGQIRVRFPGKTSILRGFQHFEKPRKTFIYGNDVDVKKRNSEKKAC